MKVAFKTYSQAPENQRPSGIVPQWPWIVVNIPEDQEAAFLNADFNVVTEALFETHRAQYQEAINMWKASFDLQNEDESLRVLSIIDERFSNLHPSKIDFRRHLQPNIYLQKDVLMLPNGRPQKSIYSLNGVLIAEIEYTFEVNTFNFMTRRTEKLAYYKSDNSVSDQWVIADDFYNSSNPYHLREMMKERSEARALIIEEVKAFLNGILASYYTPQGYTYPQILNIAGQFWDKYSTPIDSWINVGAPQFKDMLTVDTEFAFLDENVSVSVTVRQYILNKTSY